MFVCCRGVGDALTGPQGLSRKSLSVPHAPADNDGECLRGRRHYQNTYAHSGLSLDLSVGRGTYGRLGRSERARRGRTVHEPRRCAWMPSAIWSTYCARPGRSSASWGTGRPWRTWRGAPCRCGHVYRRFPSKDVLVRRIAEEETSRLTDQARTALGQEDEPWSALSASCDLGRLRRRPAAAAAGAAGGRRRRRGRRRPGRDAGARAARRGARAAARGAADGAGGRGPARGRRRCHGAARRRGAARGPGARGRRAAGRRHGVGRCCWSSRRRRPRCRTPRTRRRHRPGSWTSCSKELRSRPA